MQYTVDQPYDRALHEIYHYLDMGRAEQAREKLHKLLADYPEDGQLFFLLARCHYLLDNYDEAIQQCHEALRLDFSRESCYFLLGITYLEGEKFVEAEQAFLEALSIDPQNAEAMSAYAYLMLKTGHEEKAHRLMEEALRLDAENATVLHYNLIFTMAYDQQEEQKKILQQYVQTADSEIDKLVHMGMSELSRENYKEARELFRQAFLLDPTNKRLLEILKELDEATHILFLPQRAIGKMGGPIPVWLGFIVLMFILRSMGWGTVAGVLAIAYLILVIASWTTPLLYKLLLKWSK